MGSIYSNPLFRDSNKKKRVTPTRSEKNKIWDDQNGKCYRCPKRLSPTKCEYHHKDGDRSNWRLSNIALVCLDCHAVETNKQRIKKVHKRRREQEKQNENPFGGGFGGFKQPKGESFGGVDIFGSGKSKGKKEQPIFGGFDVIGDKKKKKGGRKDSWNFGL